MSLTNLTSAGQFAGTNLIFSGASYLTIVLAMLVINIRYMLMSVSLSQRIKEGTPFISRFVLGFGITDEAYAIACIRTEPLTDKFMFGLMTLPIIGWTLGTAAGAFMSNLLPSILQSAMGIALYAMFIAIIIPPAKSPSEVTFTVRLEI
jgi:predicted branched-subunit amino acid permease